MKYFDSLQDKTVLKKLTTAQKNIYRAQQTKRNKAFFKNIPRECKSYYCNKTCKNTILEAGRNKYPPLPKEVESDKEMQKRILKIQKKTKQELFGDKDNILKDGFYERLSPAKVKKLKKNGATSGCVQMVLDDSPAL